MTQTPADQISVADASRPGAAGARRGGAGRGRQAGAPDAGARRRPGQGARAAGGLPGSRQDAGRRSPGPGAGPGLRPGAVHPRPAAGRPHRLVPLQPEGAAASSSGAARSSPGWCSPTRSTGRRRRRSRRCSRRCRSGRSTVEGETFPLPDPFHVLATANPIEYEGTYPLPEAQLDRFLMRVSFGYPTADQEYDVVAAPPRAPARGGRPRAGHRRGRAAGRAGGRRDGDRGRVGRPLLRRARRPRPASHTTC